MTNDNINRVEIRQDIQVLRGIAVLLVVFYHLEVPFFSAGYLGVDIFFVLSGYFIASSLASQKGLAKWAVNRIFRIVPSLLVLVFSWTIIGGFVFTSSEYRIFADQALANLTFAGNYLYKSQGGYFDMQSAKKIFLNLWSLSIEVQLYFFAPILFVASRKMRSSSIMVGFLFSLILVLFNCKNIFPNQDVFFRVDYRLIQFLCGSSLFFIKSSGLSFWFLNSSIFPRVISFVKKGDLGVLLIIASLIEGGQVSVYAPDQAGIAVLGTLLILLSSDGGLLYKLIVNFRLLSFFGKISYSLYLWHWPLISFGWIILSRKPGNIEMIGLFVLSVSLSVAAFKYVENYFRKKEKISSLIVLMLLWVFLFLVNIVIEHNADYPHIFLRSPTRNDVEVRGAYLKPSGLMPDSRVINCSQEVGKYSWSLCDKLEGANIAIIGDSHAHHLFGGLINSKGADVRPLLYASASCLPLLGEGFSRSECKGFMDYAFDRVLRDSDIKIVVLSSFYRSISRNIDEDKIVEDYAKSIRLIAASGKRIVFIVDGPQLEFDPESCVRMGISIRDYLQSLLQSSEDVSNCKRSLPKSNDARVLYDQMISKLKGDEVSRFMYFFDINDIILDGGEIIVSEQDDLLYLDRHHFSIYGSKFVGERLIKLLNGITN